MTPVQQALADTVNAEIDVVVDRLVSFPDGHDKESALAALEQCREAALAAVGSTVDQAEPEPVVAPEAAVVEPVQQTELPPEGPHEDVAPSDTAPTSPYAPAELHNEGTTLTQPGDEASPIPTFETMAPATDVATPPVG